MLEVGKIRNGERKRNWEWLVTASHITNNTQRNDKAANQSKQKEPFLSQIK